jgi:hypothetical protein
VVDEGQYTKQLDRALPGPYTRRLYNGLNREEAQIVAQLRTNKNRLNSALYKIKAADTEQCEQCQRPEPVPSSDQEMVRCIVSPWRLVQRRAGRTERQVETEYECDPSGDRLCQGHRTTVDELWRPIIASEKGRS